MTKSIAESMALTKENIAAMLAIIGREEKIIKSPTAIVMLQGLGSNLKILFDKMCQKELSIAMIRMGSSHSLDDQFFEYIHIQKTQGVTKMYALANCLNSLQQTFSERHIRLIESDETGDAYEFIFGVRNY